MAACRAASSREAVIRGCCSEGRQPLRSLEGLAPDRNPLRQMRRPLPVSHLHRSHRHVLVVSPDPSRCRVARSSDGQEQAATGRFV
jgi:hypothetical protein